MDFYAPDSYSADPGLMGGESGLGFPPGRGIAPPPVKVGAGGPGGLAGRAGGSLGSGGPGRSPPTPGPHPGSERPPGSEPPASGPPPSLPSGEHGSSLQGRRARAADWPLTAVEAALGALCPGLVRANAGTVDVAMTVRLAPTSQANRNALVFASNSFMHFPLQVLLYRPFHWPRPGTQQPGRRPI